MVGPDPPFPRAPWSPAPRYSSARHPALLCPGARPRDQVAGPLPCGAPLRPSSPSFLCPPPGAYFSSAPGFRTPLPQMLSPNVTLSLASGHRDPAIPSPTASELPGSAARHPPAGPPAQRPTSPGTTSLPAHSATAATPRTFPRTQTGSGRQPRGSEPVPRLPVPSNASSVPGETGVGGAGVKRATCRARAAHLRQTSQAQMKRGTPLPHQNNLWPSFSHPEAPP